MNVNEKCSRSYDIMLLNSCSIGKYGTKHIHVYVGSHILYAVVRQCKAK